jgi:TolB-like protein
MNKLFITVGMKLKMVDIKLVKEIFMKKTIALLSLIFTLYGMVNAQQQFAIDDAMNDYAINLEKFIPKDKGIAVVAFETDNENLANYFIDTMSEYIWEKCKVDIYERSRIEALQKELNFSLTGNISDETAQKIGHLIGVGTIVYGSMRKIGNDYRMAIRATTVETGRMLFPKSYDLKNDTRLAGLLENKDKYLIRVKRFNNAGVFDYYYDQVSLVNWKEYGANGDFANNWILERALVLDGTYGIVIRRMVDDGFRFFLPDKGERTNFWRMETPLDGQDDRWVVMGHFEYE